MNRKKFTILFLIAVLGSVYMEKLEVNPMEEFNISSGLGIDIKREANANVQYESPFNVYQFKEQKEQEESSRSITGEESSRTITGKAESFGETRQNRQLKSNKPFLIGVQRIIVISEKLASDGIENLINIFFANPQINDRSNAVICKGKTEDLLSHKVKGYSSSSDYIEGMIENAHNYNFWPKENNLLSIYSTLASEGKNLVLPYIEINNREIVLAGMAIFKEDKMINVLPMEDSRIMNMLRERAGDGVITLQQSPNEYINYNTKVKRKIKCNKKEGKYEFNIDLSFRGDIIFNTLYKDINKEKEKEIEELLSRKIERMCNDFLGKMKNVYKVDLIELGMYGAAKYGRETGADWNKEVSNANIKVNVKVKIDKIGIGQH